MKKKEEVVQVARTMLCDERVRESVGEKMGIPPLYRSAHISDFEEVPHLNDRGIFITGKTGVGKTHLAAAIFMDNMLDLTFHRERVAPETCLWVSVPVFLAELRESFGNSEKMQEMDRIRAISSKKLVVLDDLAAEQKSENTSQSIYLVLQMREEARLQTIVTSNLKLSELNETDQRLASRVGGMEYWKMEGVDRRDIGNK